MHLCFGVRNQHGKKTTKLRMTHGTRMSKHIQNHINQNAMERSINTGATGATGAAQTTLNAENYCQLRGQQMSFFSKKRWDGVNLLRHGQYSHNLSHKARGQVKKTRTNARFQLLRINHWGLIPRLPAYPEEAFPFQVALGWT